MLGVLLGLGQEGERRERGGGSREERREEGREERERLGLRVGPVYVGNVCPASTFRAGEKSALSSLEPGSPDGFRAGERISERCCHHCVDRERGYKTISSLHKQC